MKVEELIKKLAHEDSDVRNSAVQALGHIGAAATLNTSIAGIAPTIPVFVYEEG